ncbi:hypothetical protein CPAR01_15967, partial [Colletotrichum paranaense]
RETLSLHNSSSAEKHPFTLEKFPIKTTLTATYQTTTMATSHSATVEDGVLEDGSKRGGTSEETEKPPLAYKPEVELLL